MLLGKIRGIFEYKIEDKFKILNGIKFCAVFGKLSENFRKFDFRLCFVYRSISSVYCDTD